MHACLEGYIPESIKQEIKDNYIGKISIVTTVIGYVSQEKGATAEVKYRSKLCSCDHP